MVEPTPLKKVQPEGKDYVQPGIDVHFETTIGDGRVMRVSTTFFQGTSLDDQRRIVREMMSVADGEKAAYEKSDLEWQRVVKRKALDRAEEDVKRIDAQNEARKAEIEIEIGVLKGQIAQRAIDHERAFRAAGRVGKFKASPAEQNELTGINRDIAKLEAEAKGIDERTSNERRDTLTALARIHQDLTQLDEEISRRRHMLGLAEEE